jgi:hypothetical protein
MTSLIGGRRGFIPGFVGLAVAGVLSLAGGTARADVYNDVNDFSSSNPSGPWGYGTLSSFSGGTFTAFNVYEALTGFTGSGEVWDSGASVPNRPSIIKNTSGGTITGPSATPSIQIPTNLLNLDCETLVVDLRFTAPTTGVYNVAGLFQREDTGGAPVNLEIVENGTTSLLLQTGVTGFGTQSTFNDNLSLTAGTTLDFAMDAPQFNNDSTGLGVTISPAAVPEPASCALLGLGAAAGLAILRRRKR